MAWRDSRQSRSRLLLFTASIVLGIAALVAINSFRINLNKDIQAEGKSLLGADLVISHNQPLSDSAEALLAALEAEIAREKSFASMLNHPASGGVRLVQVKAIEGGFPFYGHLETSPATVGVPSDEPKALVEHAVLVQMGAAIGDSVKLGQRQFAIAADLTKMPGQNAASMALAPPVVIPMRYLEETDLLQLGSRVFYTEYLLFPAGTDLDAVKERLSPTLRKEGARLATYNDRQARIGRAFENLNRFLNLIAFVALLLGCVGVASSVHLYIKEKIGTVAILRCLGLSGRQALVIYLIQIALIGLLGSVVGAALGSVIQSALPLVLKSFLPVEVSYAFAPAAALEGVLVGLGTALLFALLPLLAIRRTSPLLTLSAFASTLMAKRDPLRIVVGLAIALFVFGFAFWQTDSLIQAGAFTAGMVVAFLVLTGLARLLMWLVRKFFPVGWSFLWRQSLANLYRPNNQTPVLIVTIGLGTAILTTLFLVQGLLLAPLQVDNTVQRPDLILFDIRSEQREAVTAFAEERGLPIMQEVPVVGMRLLEINGRSAIAIRQDTAAGIPNDVLDREYRVTYRDTLIDSETGIEGTWPAQGETPGVSLSDFTAQRMQVGLGDSLVFNVQGVPLPVRVAHIRKVDWARMQTNFTVVFPSGVLEKAPQFHVLMTKAGDADRSALFQRDVVQAFPNVSVVGLEMAIKALQEILDQVTFVIQFMALFSIITGLIVLGGSVAVSKYQRIRESVLLRTIGANRNQILAINAIEYFILGAMAALAGILLALGSSWALAVYSFEVAFAPNWWPLVAVFGLITLLTLFIGLVNSRSILRNPPLEVLRKEV